MRAFQVLLFLAATSKALFCSPPAVLEKVKKIQIDPTVIEQSEKVKDPVAAELVRYDLRAAVRDARFEEGDAPIRAHIVLDEFSPQVRAKRLMDLGTGRTIRTVDGSLVIQDATGKELANVKLHLQGSVAFGPDQGHSTQGRRPASDFEQRLLEEIERLK
jgi:hypothetical protein